MEVTTQDRLKWIMKERNLRQKDICELAKPYCELYGERLGLADISAYVNGKYSPAQKKLALLGLALNVSEGWLMGLDVPMERSTAPTPSSREDFTDLTSIEKTLVSTFRTLNPNGQQLALTTMQSFAANPDLIKDTASKAG